ncbi:MAG TPA: hypothetical protein VK874_08940 [Gaiellaceae bacterium]|jgi:hypothetical protein|nr:hypothetical protein [Gaiellaceae bacterium]
MVATDPSAELAAIMHERRRLVRLVLWTLVATAATMLLALLTLLG